MEAYAGLASLVSGVPAEEGGESGGGGELGLVKLALEDAEDSEEELHALLLPPRELGREVREEPASDQIMSRAGSGEEEGGTGSRIGAAP